MFLVHDQAVPCPVAIYFLTCSVPFFFHSSHGCFVTRYMQSCIRYIQSLRAVHMQHCLLLVFVQGRHMQMHEFSLTE